MFYVLGAESRSASSHWPVRRRQYNGSGSCHPRNRSGRQGRFSTTFRRPKVQMGHPARQVGFMSTQKREDHSTPSTKIYRREIWSRQHTDSTKRASVARHACAAAKGRTASLLSILWSALAWLATKLLQTERPIRQLVQPSLSAERRGSPPPLVGSRASLSRQASPRSSIPRIPEPSGLARFRRSLPQFPADNYRRAERYDGKRDMYFQHAA
jgi:hypothetical protein